MEKEISLIITSEELAAVQTAAFTTAFWKIKSLPVVNVSVREQSPISNVTMICLPVHLKKFCPLLKRHKFAKGFSSANSRSAKYKRDNTYSAKRNRNICTYCGRSSHSSLFV